MSTVTHQTIKLSRGKHTSPEHGACVMELASMLAGEGFTDHPVSVCPVIARFLRGYNDLIDDERRQDLYACASTVVGSRACEEVQNARADRLRTWLLELKPRGWRRLFAKRRLLAAPERLSTGPLVIRAIGVIPRDAETHTTVLALLDELVALGASAASDPSRDATTGPPGAEERTLQRSPRTV